MRKSLMFVGIFLFLTMLNTRSWATHAVVSTGTGQTGPITTYSASALHKSAWAVDLQTEFMDFEEFSDSQLRKFAERGEDVHSVESLLSISLGIAYGVTENFTVGIRMPYIQRNNIKESHGDEPDEVHVHGDAKGFGDLTLLGRYRFIEDKRHALESALLFGVKMPTGKTNDHDDEGEVFDAEFQPGSGSWDPMAGLAVRKSFDSVSLDANVLYTFVTRGTQDTDLGDVFNYNLAISYRAFRNPVPLDLILEANGIWRQKQKTNGTKDKNSGGSFIFLSPGLRISWKDRVTGYLSIGIPVLDDPNGIQTDTNYRLVGGISLVF